MKKTERGELFYYQPKRKLTMEDIIEIFSIFKEINKESTIKINSWQLDEISEIHQVSKPFQEINISFPMYGKYYSTYIMVTDHVTLRISDVDDTILLGLKSKIETILNNRQNPNSKKSVIDDNANQKPKKIENDFFQKYKSIIEALVVGIVLLIIGYSVKIIFGL